MGDENDEDGGGRSNSTESSAGGGGGERQREHPFVVTEPGEVARAKKNGLDYLFHLYEQCRVFLLQVQTIAKMGGHKSPTMLAKIPKFRARPFNKKIAQAPVFSPLQRKPPQIPQFNEFHLKTMGRATRHADSCSKTSSVGTVRSQNKPLKLTAPKPPQLHSAKIQEAAVTRLCKSHNIMTVNGQFPGPAVEIREGDGLVVKVTNRGRYNVTVHWHGVRQMRTGWSDGPEFVTQCPIKPGESYTYRFTVQGQEGTLWWHAHSSWLRATVLGALIIRPRAGVPYPFNPPAREIPILLGEWWDMNPVEVVRAATRTGAAPNVSDAITVNGQPGDLYKCSSKDTTTFPVKSGETNFLRFINAALNTELFVSLAGHTMTVVGVDASYTKPYATSVLMIAPGQTTDVLVTFDQPPGRYYLAARAYASAQGVPFDNTTTTAIFDYVGSSSSSPAMPTLPAYNDTAAATTFTTSLRGLRKAELPSHVDEDLFFTVGVGLFNCSSGQNCGGPNNTRFTASINNVSFVLPSTFSILQAHYHATPGVFTADFPANPPVQFDYTAQNVSRALWQPVPGTKVYKLMYGSVVQLVLQGTNIFAAENHPIHIHGYDFYILAEGFGNFNAATDTAKFNLDDPPMRNTVAVPVNGWAVIRFVADNPGVWLMHCHLDVHITWGLAMAFLVEDGVGSLQSLEAPPPDLPLC